MKKTVMVINAFIISCMFMCATASLAANGVWNGTVDALWTNSANWSIAPYPSGSETAFFTNNVGPTTLNVAGLSSIKYITFDSPSVAAYTLGTGAINSQTNVLLDSGEIKLTATASSSQTFNSGVQLGADRGGQPYSFRNDSLTQALTFNNVFGAASGGTAGDKTLTINGVGNVAILGGVTKGGANNLNITDANSGLVTIAGTNVILNLNMTSSGTLLLTGSNTVTTLNMNGATNSVVDIGDGFIALNNGGSTTLASTQGGTINGTGKLWLSGNVGGYADNYVALGKTLTINTPIISAGGFEYWGPTPPYGTFVLNATNTFDLDVLFNQPGTISAWKIGNKGSTTSNLGKGNNITFNATTGASKLIYTGTGEESDRTLSINYNAIIDHSGTGTLKFSAPLTTSTYGKTLTLQGSTSGIGEIAGIVPLGHTVSNALLKTGSGTWILSGANLYGGATTVNGGTLLINSPGSIVSPVIVNASALLGGNGTIKASVTLATGGMLMPAKLNSFGTLSITNALTLNGNGLFFDIDGSNVSTDKVAVAGAMTVTGTNTVYLSFQNGIATIGTNTLMTFGSKSGSGSIVLAPGYANAYLMMDGTTLSLVVTNTGIYGLSWKGNESGVWDLVTPNWTNGTAAATYTEGDAVTFDDTASNFNVTSDTAVTPGSVVFNNSANAYTVSAAIAGTAELFKFGAGTTTLFGTNTYSGPTTISGGKLKIDGAGQLGAGNYVGNIVNAGVLEFASSAAQANSGVISGSGDLAVSGVGTLTLLSSNAFSGTVIVQAGSTLQAKNTFALGAVAGNTLVQAGGTLVLSDNISYAAEPLSLFGSLSSQTGTNTFAGNVSPQTGSTIDVGLNSLLILTASTLNVGAAPFSKTGAGTLRLTADPNHGGICTVAEGTLELMGGGTTDADFIINPGAILRETTACLGNFRLTANGTFDLRISDDINGLDGSGLVTVGNTGSYMFTVGNGNQSGTFSGVMENGAGMLGLTKSGSGIQILSNANTYSGATVVNNGMLLINSPGSLASIDVTVANGAILGGDGVINGAVTLFAGGMLTPGGINTIGTLTLGSSLTLNGNKLFFDISNVATDKVAIASAMIANGVNTVVINGSLPVGDYTLMTFASQTVATPFMLAGIANASLELTDTSLILHVTSGSSGSSLIWEGDQSLIWDGGSLNWLAGITPSAFATGDAVLFDDTAYNFTVNSGSAVSPASVVFNNSVNVYTVNAIIGGTASVTKFGTVNANLAGVNTYTGPTFVNQGTLAINTPGQLGSGNYAQDILINTGATFHYASTANQVLSGVISGLGAFTKSGSSTLVLTNANTYAGTTTVSGGTLIAKEFLTALGTGTLTLNGGGILELANDTGLVYGKNTTVNGTATVKAGRLTSGAGVTNTLGTLSIGNNQLNITQGATVSGGASTITFGATTLSAATPIFDVASGLTLTLGTLSGNNNFTKQNSGTLLLGTTSARAGGTTTLTAGTLRLGNASALGTTAATLTLNGGILNLATDTTVTAHPTTVGGNTTIQSDKATPNSEGITHALGNLTIAAWTLSVTNGPNVRAQSPFGLTFGSVTLTANALFDVANNGAGLGTLTLGAVSGNFSLTKKNVGTLKLVGKNVSAGATIINNGRLVGVTGGASSNSTVTVQSSGPTDASAILGVLCAGANGQWAFNNLIITNALAPATAVPALEFSFAVTPSTTIAPLLVTNKIIFATNPVVRVYLGNLGNITAGTYPLMVAGITAPTNIPALTVYGGYSGSTLSWSGNTLNLNLAGTAEEPLKWAGTGAGTWDMNIGANLVWTNSATPPVAAYYREVLGSSDQVRFDDTTIGTDQTITLDTEVNPMSITVSNVLYKYTLAGSGSIAGPIALNKTAAGTIILGTANTFSGGTVLSGGTIALGNAAGLPVGSSLSMSGTSTLDLNGFSPTLGNISASVAGNTIIDNSAGTGTNTLLLNNQSATISALIKNGPSKVVAVGLMNNNLGAPTPFALNAANTFSGGLTLKNGAGLPSGNGTRMYVNAAVTTAGSAGNITSSPFGRGPIIIGEAPADKAQLWISFAGVALHNDIIVNTTLGTDQVYAIRNDSVTTALNGAVLANADLSFGTTGTGAVTLTNRISGSGGLKLFAGAITVNLSGPNTYTGKTTVNAGTLIFNSIRNVGESASALGAPTTVANGTIDVNSVMQFNGATTTSDRIFNLTGGAGSLHNTGTGVLTLTGGMTGLNLGFMFRGVGTIVESGLINIGNGGLVHTDSGTLILTNPLNPFLGAITVADGVVSVDTIADSGQFSPLGRGDRILLGQNSGTIGKFQFTGAAGGAFNRLFLVNGTSATAGGIIENTVAGQTLTLNGNIYLGANGPAPRLQLVGVGDGVANGTINNTLSILKSGTGTWTFTGANSYTGVTTVVGGKLVLSGANGSMAGSLGYAITTGGTLLLDNTSANNADRLRDATPIILNSGTLSVTNNGTANYGEVAGALYVTNSGGTVATSETAEGMTNAISFASLTRTGIATLNFTGKGLGESDRNRIFIPGQPNGLIGFWATINSTNLAAYDATLGVIPANDAAYTNLYAKGPSIIPNDATLSARINELGTEGGIGLEGAVFNSINTLMQNTDWQATAIAMTNKTLLVNQVMVSAGNARALTLGTEQNEGFIAPLSAGGDLQLIASGADSLLTINAATTNNSTASTVTKFGPGKVVLAGATPYTGVTVINEGELGFGGTADHLRAVAISGAGLLSKSGSGTLNLNVANTYTGGTRVDGGTVNVNNINALSTGAVTNNGTLNIIGGNNVTISGLATNMSGAGTVNVTLGTGTQSTSFMGDYSGFTGTWNIGINGTNGPGRAIMTGLDNSAATINVLSNSTLWVNAAGVHNAALVLNGGDTGESYGQLRVDTAEWAGPVTLAGPITSAADGFIGSANTDGVISGIIGEVNGPYELSKVGPNKTTLTGTNTFRGPVWVKAGSISVPSINSVGTGTGPLGSPLTAAQGAIKLGYLTAAGTLIYTGTNAITDRAIELAGSTGGAVVDQSGTNALVLAGGMTITGTGAKTLTLQGSTSGTGEFSGILSNGTGSAISLTKNGTGTWTLSGTNGISGVTVNNGTLNINGLSSLGGGTLLVGNATGNRGVVTLANNINLGRIQAGVTDNANSAGAVYQNNVTVTASTYPPSLGEGTGDFGYYRFAGGLMQATAAQDLNLATKGHAVFDMMAGTLNLSAAMFIGRGGAVGVAGTFNIFGGVLNGAPTIGNYITMGGNAGHSFGQINVGGSGVLNIAGGAGNSRGLGMMYADNNTNVVNLLAGGTLIANKVYAEKATGRSIFNFNGGTLATTNASTVGATFLQGLTAAFVHAGGAIIDTTSINLTVAQSLITTTGYGVSSITLTNNGTGYIGAPAVVLLGGSGTGATAVAQHDFNSSSPTYGQVTNLLVTSSGSGYQAGDTLTVSLRGGGFLTPAGATCTLGANPVSGGLTKLGSGTLTLSGRNTYAGATTISSGTLRLGVANALPTNSVVNVGSGTLDLGGFTVTNGQVNVTSGSIVNGRLTSASITVADSAIIRSALAGENGLTKNGNGTLILNRSGGSFTTGPLVVNGGTLRLVSGPLDVGLSYWLDATDTSKLTFANTTNVTVWADSAADGVNFTQGTPANQPVYVTNAINGLPVVRFNGTTQKMVASKTANAQTVFIVNTSRSTVNGDGIWGQNGQDYGIRVGSSTSWQFPGNVNDLPFNGGQMYINGVSNNTFAASTPHLLTTVSATLRTGWTTAIGQYYQTSRWYNGDIGELLVYNSILSTNDRKAVEGYLMYKWFGTANTNLPAVGSVVLASGTLLDLGGQPQAFAGISGSGTVSNGALTVTGTLSPAATNAIGTLTVKANTTLSGKLLVNVATDGTSDVLDVQGNLNLLSPTLEIADLAGLSTIRVYTLANYSGSLSGSFTSTNLPERWVLRTTGNKIQLYYKGGTMVRIM